MNPVATTVIRVSHFYGLVFGVVLSVVEVAGLDVPVIVSIVVLKHPAVVLSRLVLGRRFFILFSVGVQIKTDFNGTDGGFNGVRQAVSGVVF